MFEPSFLIGAVPGIVGLLVYNRLLSRKLPQTEGWPYFFTIVVLATPYYLIFLGLKSIPDSEPLTRLIILAIPGIVGLFIYSRLLSRKLLQTKGWPYFIVVAFAITYYLIFVGLKSIPDSETNSETNSEPFIHLIILAIAIPIAILIGIYAAKLKNKYDSPVLDPFRDCCYLWRRKLVFITLKDSKVYLAVLLDHTGDLRFESSIRIIPIYSGYRDEKRDVIWTFRYPIGKTLNEEEVSDKKFEKSEESGIIIFQKDIITFSFWDPSQDYEDSPLNREK